MSTTIRLPEGWTSSLTNALAGRRATIRNHAGEEVTGTILPTTHALFGQPGRLTVHTGGLTASSIERDDLAEIEVLS